MLNDDDFDRRTPPTVEPGIVAIDRDKAEQLCKTYELYRKAHDHATAFGLAYGIEIEGLPF